jgi:extradiol dioxygenase family protein
MHNLAPFHLAFPVHNLAETRRFYGDLLGCAEGRSSEQWIDFNLYGHQIVAHLVETSTESVARSDVDGHEVPVRHFGVVLPHEDWRALADRLVDVNVEFIIEPGLRFEGKVGAQWTLFIKDPSGNALEFKSMVNPDDLFAH